MVIKNIHATSGACYTIGTLHTGNYQYADRLYQFNYVPYELSGCLHIKTCGNDKMISENDVCLTFELEEDADVYVLYADKHPILPQWLNSYEKIRLNVTRMDSLPANLKGYFSLYRKRFPKGEVTLFGCSPEEMLACDWYVESEGTNFCMYSVCVKELSSGT